MRNAFNFQRDGNKSQIRDWRDINPCRRGIASIEQILEILYAESIYSN